MMEERSGKRWDEANESQKWSLARCSAFVTGIAVLFGAVETALVFALKVFFPSGLSSGSKLTLNKQAVKRDLRWPVILMGVLSTALLSAGVLRHYWDIYIHRTVRGISFIFVGIDAAGDVFSLVSVCTYLLPFVAMIADSL